MVPSEDKEAGMVVSSSRAHSTPRWALPVAIALGLLIEPPVGGQEVDESQFKAAFVFNVAKFVEWPPASFAGASDPIVVCILGETPVDAALAQAPGTIVEGRKVLVRHIRDVKDATACHILFVSASEQKRWRWTSDVKNTGVLTVGESNGFASDGGVVDFKLENSKVRIEVNLDAAQRAGLRFSSKLLNLSTIVKR
jgi:uncharacterized protein DUF4154